MLLRILQSCSNDSNMHHSESQWVGFNSYFRFGKCDLRTATLRENMKFTNDWCGSKLVCRRSVSTDKSRQSFAFVCLLTQLDYLHVSSVSPKDASRACLPSFFHLVLVQIVLPVCAVTGPGHASWMQRPAKAFAGWGWERTGRRRGEIHQVVVSSLSVEVQHWTKNKAVPLLMFLCICLTKQLVCRCTL